jgi:hypothetical protein
MGKVIAGAAIGANLSKLDVARQNATLFELHSGNGPEVEVEGLFLKVPKVFGELMFIILKFSVIGTQRRRDADNKVVRLGAELSLHCVDEAGVDILRTSAPA